MNKEIRCITNKGKMAKNEWEMMTLTFVKLNTVYI